MYINLEKSVKVTAFGKVFQPHGNWRGVRSILTNLLIYIKNGTMDMQIGDETVSGKSGDILIIPQNVPYKPLDSPGVRYYFLHFIASVMDKHSENEFNIFPHPNIPSDTYAYETQNSTNNVITIPTLSHCAENNAIKKLFEMISGLNVYNNNSEKLLLDVFAQEILIRISLELNRFTSFNKHLTQILQYIEENYADNLTLTHLSEKFGLSASYIARLFKTELNTTSVKYINNIRISAACELLANTNLSIAQISEYAGYTNQYYFTRVFQQVHNMTPSGFRNKHRIFKP